MSPRSIRRPPAGARCRPARLVAAGLLVVVLSSCGATVRISVDARVNGTGWVVVTVALDRQAVAAVGEVAGQLRTADLTAAGWQVAPPVAGPGGSEVLTARRPFSSLAQVGPIVAQVSGSGPAATRSLRFSVVRTRGLWRTTTAFRGAVDLACGLACFGDPGLAQLTGQPNGADPTLPVAPAGAPAGIGPV
ncbi:MAG: hypothetical protein ACRDY0_07415, partial [Acidimicrobiales bacterium]